MALSAFGCLSWTALVSEEASTCQHPASSAPTWLRLKEAMLHLPSPLACQDFFWLDGVAWVLAALKSWGAVRSQTRARIVQLFSPVLSKVMILTEKE